MKKSIALFIVITVILYAIPASAVLIPTYDPKRTAGVGIAIKSNIKRYAPRAEPIAAPKKIVAIKTYDDEPKKGGLQIGKLRSLAAANANQGYKTLTEQRLAKSSQKVSNKLIRVNAKSSATISRY